MESPSARDTVSLELVARLLNTIPIGGLRESALKLAVVPNGGSKQSHVEALLGALSRGDVVYKKKPVTSADTITICNANLAQDRCPSLTVNYFGGNMGHFFMEGGFNGAYSLSRSQADVLQLTA